MANEPPAAEAGRSATTKERSGLRLRLMPALTPEAVNPKAAVTPPAIQRISAAPSFRESRA